LSCAQVQERKSSARDDRGDQGGCARRRAIAFHSCQANTWAATSLCIRVCKSGGASAAHIRGSVAGLRNWQSARFADVPNHHAVCPGGSAAERWACAFQGCTLAGDTGAKQGGWVALRLARPVGGPPAASNLRSLQQLPQKNSYT